MRLKSWIVTAACKAKLPKAYLEARILLKGNWAVILVYHRVDNPRNYPWIFRPIHPTDFEKEIKMLKKRFDIISLEDLHQNIKEKRPFKNNLAVITFDDGFKDNYLNAYPILKKYNLPATIYLTTSRIDSDEVMWSDKINYVLWHTHKDKLQLKDMGEFLLNSPAERLESTIRIKDFIKHQPLNTRELIVGQIMDNVEITIPNDLSRKIFLSWEDIIEMRQNSISFGAHTISHERLSELTKLQAEQEIVKSKQILEDKLQFEITSFAYPFGGVTDYTSETKELVKNSGFKNAVTLKHNIIENAHELIDLYELPRISGTNLIKFILYISGLPFDFKRS